jgi:hypothetical protein
MFKRQKEFAQIHRATESLLSLAWRVAIIPAATLVLPLVDDSLNHSMAPVLTLPAKIALGTIALGSAAACTYRVYKFIKNGFDSLDAMIVLHNIEQKKKLIAMQEEVRVLNEKIGKIEPVTVQQVSENDEAVQFSEGEKSQEDETTSVSENETAQSSENETVEQVLENETADAQVA